MKRLAMAGLLCLIICFSAFAQERGVLQCKGDMTFAPAWTAPGSSDLVAGLSCGQTLNILGLEKGYYRIQIGDRIAYIDKKYIKLQPMQSQQEEQAKDLQQPTSTPKPSVPPSMTIYGEATRFSVSGMFTWSRSFTDNFSRWPFGSRDYLGWDATFVGNIAKNLALEFDVSGNYWITLTKRYHSISGGPRYIFPGKVASPYVHFLFGLTRGSSGGPSDQPSINALMLAPGFGVDVPINERFAARAFQLDWIVLHSEGALGGWSMTNLRMGAGFAIKF
jgi:hypothetical protein